MQKARKPAIICIALIACAVLILFLVQAAGTVQSGSNVIYQSDTVTVSKVPPLQDIQYTSCTWSVLTEDRVYSVNTVIFVGTVKNVREVEVVYTSDGKTCTERVTLFDVDVERYLRNDSATLEEKATLTVGHGFSSAMYPDGVLHFEEGKEYLLFCTDLKETYPDHPMRIDAYTDCYVMDPYRLVLEVVDDSYIVSDFFAPYLSNVQTLQNFAQDSAACLALESRTQDGSGTYEILASSSYTVECSEMERIITDALDNWKAG